jgi:hypothetical protein
MQSIQRLQPVGLKKHQRELNFQSERKRKSEMHRNRTWSFTSPLWRLNHNRILDADGYIPALLYLLWSPFNVVLVSTLTVLGPLRNANIISETYQPVRLKWNLITGTIPRNVILYYRKNGGAWVSFAENTFTAVTFTTGDTFQLGIQTGTSIGTFSLALFNDVDGLQCSEVLSISVV